MSEINKHTVVFINRNVIYEQRIIIIIVVAWYEKFSRRSLITIITTVVRRCNIITEQNRYYSVLHRNDATNPGPGRV